MILIMEVVIMIDKVEYWLDLCDDNSKSAKLLLNGKQYLDAGFFCHQIAEKALKAVIAENTAEIPPKIHKLSRLADMAHLTNELSDDQIRLLVELDPLNIEARYPDYKASIAKTLNAERTTKILAETERFLCWIKKRLGK